MKCFSMFLNVCIDIYFRFNRLTEQYFTKCPWPEAEAIAPLVQDGKIYLYNKHLAAKDKIYGIFKTAIFSALEDIFCFRKCVNYGKKNL